METLIHIFSLIGAYICYSLFIMSLFLEKEGDSFTYKIKTMTIRYNEQLYQQYKDKKISAYVYQKNKKDIKQELRTAKRVNMIVSPILALPITLTLIIRYMCGD